MTNDQIMKLIDALRKAAQKEWVTGTYVETASIIPLLEELLSLRDSHARWMEMTK